MGQAVITPIQDGYLVSNIGDSYNDGALCTPEPAYNEFSLTLDLNDIISGAEISIDYFSLTDVFMFGIRVSNETRGVYPLRYSGTATGASSIIGWRMGNKVFEYQIQIGIPCGAFQVDQGGYPVDFSGSSSGTPSIIDWSKNNDEIITWKYGEESWDVDHIEIVHIDHDYYIGIGNCRVYGSYPQEIGNTGEFTIKHLQASNPPITNLNAEGYLSWIDVQVGSIVEGSFLVENIGEPESNLRWELESCPNWGTWTLTPNCGNYLTPEDGKITVQVEVIAPNEPNQQFDGEIKIVNTKNSSDFDLIETDLKTPRNKALNSPIYRFFSHFTNLFQILKIILQRFG